MLHTVCIWFFQTNIWRIHQCYHNHKWYWCNCYFICCPLRWDNYFRIFHDQFTDCEGSVDSPYLTVKVVTYISRNHTKCGNQCSRRSRDCGSRWWWTSFRYWKYLAYQFYPRFDFSKFQLWIKYLRLGYWCNACSCEPGRWSHWSFQRFVCPILLYFSLFGKTVAISFSLQSVFKTNFPIETS